MHGSKSFVRLKRVYASIYISKMKYRAATLREKSVQIRSFLWFIFSCIQSKYKKIRTRKNSVFGHFSCSGIFPINQFGLSITKCSKIFLTYSQRDKLRNCTSVDDCDKQVSIPYGCTIIVLWIYYGCSKSFRI